MPSATYVPASGPRSASTATFYRHEIQAREGGRISGGDDPAETGCPQDGQIIVALPRERNDLR